mgnify:CR=1 FL=1
MSRDLVSRWRKMSREHYEAAVALEQGRLQAVNPTEAASLRSYVISIHL